MDRWLKYFTERFSFISSAALISGIILSATYLKGRDFHFLPFTLSFIGIIFVWALACLMDDVKDLEKDRIAYPNRPLPKGLITKQEAVHLIDTMRIVLFVYGLLLWILLSASATLAYLVVVAYFWLMERDFGMGLWMGRHPFIYGFLNQFLIVPIVLFAVVANASTISNPEVWSFALMMSGAVFCCDICGKLNPHAHPVLATYIHYYGFRKVFNVAVMTLAVSAMGAVYLRLAYLLIPCEAIVLAALSTVFFDPSLFRIPQFMAGISLLVHAWAIVIYRI